MKQVYINHSLREQAFQHLYNIENIKGPETSATVLKRTDSEKWSDNARDEVALVIEDAGDGLIIKQASSGESIVLEYHEAEELFILLAQQDLAPFEIKETKTTMKWQSSQ